MLKTILFFLFVGSGTNLLAQPENIVSSKALYKESIKLSPKNTLVDLKKKIPTIILDLKYSTTNNFTKTNLYQKTTTTYLRFEAANALEKVNEALQEKNYTIKIFDAYRPYRATVMMWELIKDERYVANPKNGSNHNKGLAIDLTIVDSNGRELNMGTGFDNFSDTAHHTFTALPSEVLQNRLLLKKTMEQNGFKALDTEWWHYSFVAQETYTVMDLSFKQLKKLIK